MYTPIMENIVRGALAGIAIAGFTAAVLGANQIAMEAVGHFNYLALEMGFVMARAAWEKIIREQQQQQRLEAEYDSADEAED